MKVLVLGDGKLGSEIINQTNWNYISRKKDGFDFTNAKDITKALIEDHHGIIFTKKYDIVINCIANTDTYSTEKYLLYKVNYESVANLSDICSAYKIKLVHISTDYIYTGSNSLASEEDLPVPSTNWYTYYKLLADEYIMLKNKNYLICRCSFKSNPFQYKTAWIDQVGNFDYVNVIANLIIKLIEKDVQGLFNVGTELKSIYDLAIQTNPTVNKTIKISEAPNNISMNLDKLNSIL
jgi:dTDP-4-dehydrorhamnose reductase